MAILLLSFLLFLTFIFFPAFTKFNLSLISGVAVNGVLISFGAILTWKNDIRNDSRWNTIDTTTKKYLLRIEEPLVEKANSYKAIATAQIIDDTHSSTLPGRIVVYLQKDSMALRLGYGSHLVTKKEFQEIKNSGNPGSFDYKRYCLFQGITHQVFLANTDYKILKRKSTTWLNRLLFGIEQEVISILSKNIPNKESTGLAEALLIGYKDDLDRELVQSYSNTGVVHVIAISGLHLGLVYWLLMLLLKPLASKKSTRWVIPVIVIIALWLFSLVAGAQPSVIRSAVMFTCIVLGENLSRKGSIINTLACSAFLLLCYNPYWLWDAGFQLSYAAVLSIVLFSKPIYNLLYVKNKLFDMIWKLNAVTIAAQALTSPFSLYHFHQFPVYFIPANMIAVPLSSLILILEIFLCAIAFFEPLSILIGRIINLLISFMNHYIKFIDALPFSLWPDIQISTLQAIFLTISILCFGSAFIEKKRDLILYALLLFFMVMIIRTIDFYRTQNQKQIIVYNIPKQSATDLIKNNKVLLLSNEKLANDVLQMNFHIKPARLLNRAYGHQNEIHENSIIEWESIKILHISENLDFDSTFQRKLIDLLIISKNPRLYMRLLAKQFDIRQVVADGSTPVWKTVLWKNDCDSFRIPFHDTKQQGAFVMNLR